LEGSGSPSAKGKPQQRGEKAWEKRTNLKGSGKKIQGGPREEASGRILKGKEIQESKLGGINAQKKIAEGTRGKKDEKEGGKTARVAMRGGG